LAQRGCGAITIWPMDEKQVKFAPTSHTVVNNFSHCRTSL
jgi:hypothetical protein